MEKQKIIKMIEEKKSIREIIEKYPVYFIKNHRQVERMLAENLPERNWPMEVHIRWGKTGTGKTRYVYDTYDMKISIVNKIANGGADIMEKKLYF